MEASLGYGVLINVQTLCHRHPTLGFLMPPRPPCNDGIETGQELVGLPDLLKAFLYRWS